LIFADPDRAADRASNRAAVPVPVPCLARLFERDPVCFEEVSLSEPLPPPHPQEAEQVATAVPARRIEFAAGRHCARRALARLSIEGFVLRNGADRAPRWPVGVVGAITHTQRAGEGYCGVVVGRTDRVVTVGLDAEQAEPLATSLWPHVLTAGERRSLQTTAADTAGYLARVIFSAKECFYKAQFALSRQFLRFHDVEISLDPGEPTFAATLTRDAPRGLPLTSCRGRFLPSGGFVVTGIALRA
jgi:4'-phosphopantetheinyl transferase EntD